MPRRALGDCMRSRRVVVLSDQDSRALGRLLEQTSKLVLSFGRCVGSFCSPALLVARDITLPLRRKYLLGCVMILHDGILAIMAKMGNGLGGGRQAVER
jgi:hypothetical protein